MTAIRIARTHHPLHTLGVGVRLGIWLQGCTISCPGCMSRDTWDPTGGRTVEVDELSAAAAELQRSGSLDGVTITGGEPLEQPDAVHDLLIGLQPLRQVEVDVLLYSGLEPSVAEETAPWLAELVDVAVLGPYRAAEGRSHALAGSANQKVVAYSDLGMLRSLAANLSGSDLQVVPVDDHVRILGIPDRGDLSRLEACLREQGVGLEDPSWR